MWEDLINWLFGDDDNIVWGTILGVPPNEN